ncbi:MAG: TIGR03067 domain-containing protein [Planctomycetaceae bacterium]
MDDTLRATDCHVIVSARQTTLQGEAAEIQFDSKTHIAILTDAVLRTSVAVIGEDLEDLTTLQAKAMTIDMRSFQIKAEAATTVVDFSIRESSVLDGEWDVVAMQGDGVAATSTELKTQRWSVAGNEITGLAHGTSGKMSFTLDTAHTPHQINITPPDGNGKGITIAGIFEMTGQRLRICLAEQGHDRPMEFRAGPESWTIELKRIAETTVERK